MRRPVTRIASRLAEDEGGDEEDQPDYHEQEEEGA